MSKQSSDPDQELLDLIARDREEKRAQDARAAESRRQERERQRIPPAIDALRRSGPLDDRSADAVWLDLLARLLDALADNGKAGVLDRLPKRGNARLFTRRCIELLRTGKRPQALDMLESIERGNLDAELARERNAELPDDLCRLLKMPLAQSLLKPHQDGHPEGSEPNSGPAPEQAAAGRDMSHLTQEEAAILKVLQAAGVTMTVEDIEAKVRISGKTIGTRLRDLRNHGLVEEPRKKKGFALTAAGGVRAANLPAEAAAKFLKDARRGG